MLHNLTEAFHFDLFRPGRCTILGDKSMATSGEWSRQSIAGDVALTPNPPTNEVQFKLQSSSASVLQSDGPLSADNQSKYG